jgi:hypothetical protein
VHFEIIGSDPAALRGCYAELLGWEYAVGGATAEGISQPDDNGFVDATTNGDGIGINGGINGGVGGGAGYRRQALLYVGVPDVEAVLRAAERLGGTRQMGPAQAPGGDLVVGHLTDPEGNLIGVAGLA